MSVRLREATDAIRRETNGRLDINVFPSGVLGADPALVEQVREGAIAFTANSGAILSSITPLSGIDNVAFAFRDTTSARRAVDGALGALIRSELGKSGFFVFQRPFDTGFRQVTSASRQIRKADDFAGFKIRTPQSRMFYDMFHTLGASPTPVELSSLYVSLQTKLVDGQETPYSFVENAHLFEVQHYLSVTNHAWTGFWLIANPGAWNALPADLRAIAARNFDAAVDQERHDIILQTAALADRLRRQGMTFITDVDVPSMRDKLKPYYARWKAQFGETAWSLLESTTGRLA